MLGQSLIKAGLLTPDQLEETLKNQVIFGGRLGTNLIELGYLDERQIARFLSQKLGVPAATREQLKGIPPNIINIITTEIAQKYLVIPLSLDRKRLTVVMADPSDFTAIDELSFLTGCIITPLVAPELLLMNALEHYFKVKRKTRYIPVAKEMRDKARQSRIKPQEEEAETFVPATSHFDATDDTIELPPLPDSVGFGELGEAPSPVPVVEEIDTTADSVRALCTQLAEAPSRDGITQDLIQFLGREYLQAALFLVKGENITGWIGMSNGELIERFAESTLRLANSPAMSQTVHKKQFYMGPLLSEQEKEVYTILGGKGSTFVLLVPIVLAGRVVALLSVGDSLENLTRGLTLLQKLADKVGFAFEILILKNKILLL